MGAAQPPPIADSSLCIWRGDVLSPKRSSAGRDAAWVELVADGVT